MRQQQQQQNRSRNRNRGRRTSNNPQSRNFESNGPDVKIRGNANHIAEKYNQLARDALTSGDTVMSENYFQHAEHYSRIVAANQKTNPQPSNNQQQNNRDGRDDNENNSQDENKNPRGDGPQPVMSETPAEVSLKEENVAVNEDKGADKSAKEEKTPTRRNGRRPATTRRTSRVAKNTDDDASLSDDAASLPSSLIGGSSGDEEASTSSED